MIVDDDGPDSSAGLVRSTARVVTGNLASRVTGLLRVLAVGAALGATFLGNTYQSANLVSNLLFELLAAGILSSVLVPPFVRLLDAGRRDEAEHVAGSFLGVGLIVLGAVCVAGILGRTWIMQVLTVTVPDPEVRAAQVRLGSFLLVLFLPQVLLYAVGTVATALLHGARRFSAVAFAPVANNVIVIATMALFWAVSGGGTNVVSGRAGLDLSTTQKLILAIGTTTGVVLMSLVPLVAAWRNGLRLRPRWDPRHPSVRTLARAGGWGAMYLAVSQVLIATTLVLANRVPGGVVAYQIAFALFLLPHALLAQPLITVLYPRLASEAVVSKWREFSGTLTEGARWVIFLTAPAAALLAAAAGPGLDLVRFGHLDSAGTQLVARVAAAYAIGIVGYAGFLLVTRASYAAGDTRAPALVNLGITAGGSVLMLVLFAGSTGGDRVVVLGLAYSAAMTAGAGLLLGLVRRRGGERIPIAAALTRATVGAVAAWAAARLVVDLLSGSPGGGAAAQLIGAALAAAGIYLAAQWLMRAPELPVAWRLVARALESRAQTSLAIERSGPPGEKARPVVAIVAAKDQAGSVADTTRALSGIAGVDRVIVVDDGSTDETTSTASAAGATVVRLGENVGKGGAVGAGLKASPEAEIYLLVDADVGSTAGHAAALLDPVVSGETDMTIGVLPPAGPGGGFGKVRDLARAGIRLATGRRMQAPLSGQRAVRASLLRSLELAPRFGLEVGLTVDALRAGAGVIEVPVPMGHRERGRGPRGFAHRAHQGVDIVRALWPRLTSPALRIAVIVTAFVLGLGALTWSGARSEATSVPGRAVADQVLLVGVPGLSFDDVRSGRMPNFERLAEIGALGAMNVRTLSDEPSAVEAYASLGAGSRVEAPSSGIEFTTNADGSLVVGNASAFRAVNASNHVATMPGSLGDALNAAGHRTAVVGSASAAPALMDSSGRVDEASVEAHDNILVSRVLNAFTDAKVMVVHTADAQDADSLIARLEPQVPARTLVVVVGVTPPGDEWRLTPLVATGAGVVPGTLHSPSTKHLGLVTLTDLAPTVLAALGEEVASDMVGRPLRYHPGTADIGRLARLDDDGAFRERLFAPAGLTFLGFQFAVYALAALVLRNPSPRAVNWQTLARMGALAIAAFPLACFVLRAFPAARSLGSGGGVVAVFVIDAILVALATRARRHPLSPLAWLAGTTVLLLVVDAATGGRLQMGSLIGVSPQTSGRFFGFGNRTFAVLAATSILAAVLHVHHALRRGEALVTAALLLGAVAVVDGAPVLGGDAGGILTLVPVFALTVVALARGRLTGKSVLTVAVITVIVAGMAAGVDVLRPPEARTHLGRFVADIWNGDLDLFTTLGRRSEANLNTLWDFPLAWTVPVMAVALIFMAVRGRALSASFPVGSPLRFGLIAILTAGLLGFAVNDSGVVVTVLALSYAGPFIVLVGLARRRARPELLQPTGSPSPSLPAAIQPAS